MALVASTLQSVTTATLIGTSFQNVSQYLCEILFKKKRDFVQAYFNDFSQGQDNKGHCKAKDIL
jgi:hypothetical protein